MIKFILVLFFIVNIYGIETLNPTYSLKASGDVQDIVYQDNKLYAATSEGSVDIFDTKDKKLIQKIKISNIKDFMGDSVASKIYSVDILNGQLLIVSQGMKGYRNLWLYSNNKLEKIIDITQKQFIKKGRFLSKNEIIFATLSNQIIKYDLDKKQIKYTIQPSSSSFSDFTLNEDKKKVAITDESGIVRVLDTKNGKLIKEYEAVNLDRVYQLDYKNEVVLTAGQDRKAVIYKGNKSNFLDFNFLLYSCGLSPSGKLGAVAYNEQNDVIVFDTKTLDRFYNLTKNKATLTKILFIDEKELFATSDSSKINYWRLP